MRLFFLFVGFEVQIKLNFVSPKKNLENFMNSFVAWQEQGNNIEIRDHH